MRKPKIFRIWNSNGKPENVQADRAEFTRTPQGLSVLFFTGKRKKRMTGIVMMTEMVEETIVEIPQRPMVDHDEE